MTTLTPRPAATVVLLREGDSALEALLVQRHPELVFGGGAHVFPGGRVDASDFIPLPGCTLDDATASLRVGVDTGGLAYLQAAMRECFEEAGILLAEHADGSAVAPGLQASMREALRRGDTPLGAALAEHGLVPGVRHLRYLSHWVTPPGRPRRFDTRFFVAQAPEAQEAEACGEETVTAVWITPDHALWNHEHGHMTLMGPTRATLSRLANHATIASLFRELEATSAAEPRKTS